MSPSARAARLAGALAGALGLATLAAAAAARQDEQAERAEALWSRGERIAALEAWSAALARDPGDDALRARLVEAELATHRYEAALSHCAPLGAEADRWRGPALYFLGRLDEAAAVLAPDDAARAFMLVDALTALGRFAQADEALAAALARYPDDPRLLAFEGERRARAGDDAGALAAYDAALARDPLAPAALFGRGRALVRLGRRDEGLAALARHREVMPWIDAHEAARRAIDLDPSHAASHAQLGDVERGLGRSEQALAAYARAAALAGDDELAPIVLRWARLLHEDLGRGEEAVARLDEAAARVPDARLPVRAGDVLLALGRADEAVTRFERAQALRPEDDAVGQRLAQARALAADHAAPEPPR